jgi:glycosyltransferase involved in cell wall biosynthesis
LSKNIIFITSEFPPLPGGIGNHAFNLALHLTKLGYKITVITNYRSDEKVEEIKFDESQPFNIIRIKREKLLLKTYFNRIYKAYTVKKINNDSLIIASGKFSLWTVAILNLFMKNKKSFSVIHGSELFQGNYLSKKLTKFSLLTFETNIAVSNFTKKLILKVNPKLNVEIINNGFSSNNLINIPVKSDFVSIVTIGNLTFRKGQQNVIKALPYLMKKFPKIHYHCIGIPTELDNFSQLAKSLNVIENITFHGALSEEEKNNILVNSTVFCMLSSNLVNGDVEGFGIAVLEANNYGIPAIGSSNSGIADAIMDKYSGLLIDPENHVQFCNAMEEIINNYKHYSENAQNWSNNFEWNKVVLKYVNVLNK